MKLKFIPYRVKGEKKGEEMEVENPVNLEEEHEESEPSIAIQPTTVEKTPSTLSDYITLHALLEEEKQLPQQGTKEWLALRSDCVTASQCSDILGQKRAVLDLIRTSAETFNEMELKFSAPYASRNALLSYKLTKNEPPKNPLMQMGTMEEQLIRHYLERECFRHDPRDLLFPVKCRRHPNHPWLMASPDGILLHPLRLVEYKTLQKRKSEPGKVPHRYYVQCQVQLDCYQLHTCEYIEARVIYFPTKEEWMASQSPTKSMAIFRQGLLLTQPLDQEEAEFLDQSGVQVFYHLVDIQRITIRRDDAFLKSIRPLLFNFYKDFQHTCPNTTLALNRFDDLLQFPLEI